MENLPMRIVNEADLAQCIFWLAYDQPPLFADHEDLRVFAVEKAYVHLQHDANEVQIAKEQLIMYLSEGRIEATGYLGEPGITNDGHIDTSNRCVIDHIHWRSIISNQNWDDSTLNSTMTGDQKLFTTVRIPTLMLFQTFPHDDMASILDGHENKNTFRNQADPEDASRGPALPKDNEVDPVGDKSHQSVRKKGQPKVTTIKGWKADYEEVERQLKLHDGRGGIMGAAKEAARYGERSAQAFKDGHRHYIDYLNEQKSKK